MEAKAASTSCILSLRNGPCEATANPLTFAVLPTGSFQKGSTGSSTGGAEKEKGLGLGVGGVVKENRVGGGTLVSGNAVVFEKETFLNFDGLSSLPSCDDSQGIAADGSDSVGFDLASLYLASHLEVVESM